MVKIIVMLILCWVWYDLGKLRGYKDCKKLFEEFHRQRCLRCEMEE